MDLPADVTLTIEEVGRPIKLHKKLLPLLENQCAPIHIRIPPFPRANGTTSRSFVYTVALRQLPDTYYRTLFSFRKESTSEFTSNQRKAYAEMPEECKQQYALLYTEEEWRNSSNASRNVGKAKSKVKSKTEKLTIQKQVEDEQQCTTATGSATLVQQSHKQGLKRKELPSTAPTAGPGSVAMRTYQKIFADKAAQGDADAQVSLAVAHDASREDDMAVKWYQQAALQGHPRAHYLLGEKYEYGQGISCSLEQAALCYQKAADQTEFSDPTCREAIMNAQYNLADMYQRGKGVPQCLTKAAELFHTAAEQGHRESQCALGNLYTFGSGVPETQEKAVQWWEKAARQGDDIAQHNLGQAYRDGRGVKQSFTKAAELFLSAANGGDQDAASHLAKLFSRTDSGMYSEALAMEWWTIAAAMGEPIAQFQLGQFHESGARCSVGVEQSLTKAMDWYKRAAAQGHADAQQRLAVLHKTPPQKIESHEEQKQPLRDSLSSSDSESDATVAVRH